MLACSGLSWTQFSLLRSAHWDLSQTRPVCVPRLSQESVLTFHTLSLSCLSLMLSALDSGWASCCHQGEAVGHLLLHIIWREKGDPSIWRAKGDPQPSRPLTSALGETSLPWPRVTSQTHQAAPSTACAVGGSWNQPVSM